MIVVINYGGQYCHLIARRIRDMNVYSEIIPYNAPYQDIERLRPDGIIMSGGPSSVNQKGSPMSDKEIFDMGIPILGICYGQQLIAKQLDGKVVADGIKEYGKKILTIKKEDRLFQGLKEKEQVWMSHGDLVEKLPDGFITIGSTDTCKNAAIADNGRKIYGVQFHPEVVHTPSGSKILENFIFKICKAKKDFHIEDMPKKLIHDIKKTIKNDSVIMGISGGVDSTVAAVLINKAIGEKLHCVLIDHGLLRKDEIKNIKEKYDKMKLNVEYVDASKLFLDRLKEVVDPEEKRKIIGHTFIEVFEDKEKDLAKKYKDIKFLGMGTIYPDRIESAQPSKQADKIKSHHNLTLPDKMKLKVIEPINEFYKDDVRRLGEELKIPKDILYRHPFPGPGLAVRILGEITPDRVRILREADHIFMSGLEKDGLYDDIWQAFAALLPIKTVGVMGDARTYEYIITLRAVTSKDAMTADWAKLPNDFLENISNKIINEVHGVNRVVYDITQKPPGTIEYE
ncbi:MAG: glutamine-hydrolyzing GMP synthase [Nanoarchaeota archaeon]